MNDCIFCKIAANQIPSTKVYEDEHTLAFSDLHPQAPVHILVIPKLHYAGIHEVPPQHADIYSQLLSVVATIVKEKNLIDKGYRLVVNFGEFAGQAVDHIHVHILGGRVMQWPPG